MRTPSFRDVEVIFRGKRAWVQARKIMGVSGNFFKVEVSSIRIEGVEDHRSQEIQHTFHEADPEGETSRVKAFSGLDEAEQADLMRQVKDALRG